MSVGQYIIAVGNLTAGFYFVGPFDSFNQASEYADKKDEATRIIPLAIPVPAIKPTPPPVYYEIPWDVPGLKGWSIIGMNHYREGGLEDRHLYVSMTKDGRCITAQGSDEIAVFERLEALAYREETK